MQIRIDAFSPNFCSRKPFSAFSVKIFWMIEFVTNLYYLTTKDTKDFLCFKDLQKKSRV
jgi:hypothetical protein